MTNNNYDLGGVAHTTNDLLWPWGFHSPSGKTPLPKMEQRGPTQKNKIEKKKEQSKE